MTNSIHEAYISEGARQILDRWEADRVAGKYQLSRIKAQGPAKDILVKSQDKSALDGKNDGKISLKEKVFNFGKGLTVPIQTVLSSPSNLVITLGSIAACGGLIALTGGAIAPFLAGAGIIGGGVSIFNGIYKQSEAKTDEEAKQAWQNIGSGTFIMGLSALGAKTAAKEAGINVSDKSGFLSSSIKCITNLPGSITKSAASIASKFKSGNPSSANTSASQSNGILSSIKNFFSSLKGKIFPSTPQSTEITVQTASKKNNKDIIEVPENQIEVLPPEPKPLVVKTPKKESEIIDADAEFVETVPTNRQLPPFNPKLLEAPKE